MSTASASPARELYSRSPEESRVQLTQAGLCPHRLDILGHSTAFEVRHRCVPVGTVVLSELAYGTPVRVSHRHAEDSYVVHVPTVGQADSTIAGHRLRASPTLAAVIGPDDPVSMRWQAHSPHLMVRLERRHLESTLRRMYPKAGPLRAPPSLDLSSPPGHSWWELVQLALRDAEHRTRLNGHPLATHHLQQLLVTEFLLATGYADTPAFPERHPAEATPAVRRARELMHAHASEPLTVADVAEAVGVGVRSLQQGFRSHLDVTPMAYLRQVRLARVRAELTTAPSTGAVRVTEVAFRWGFVHPGRFAQAYKQRYGESPSTTLAKHRATASAAPGSTSP